MATTCIPEKYRLATAATIEDALRDAILDRIDSRKIACADIYQWYPAFGRVIWIASATAGQWASECSLLSPRQSVLSRN